MFLFQWSLLRVIFVALAWFEARAFLVHHSSSGWRASSSTSIASQVDDDDDGQEDLVQSREASEATSRPVSKSYSIGLGKNKPFSISDVKDEPDGGTTTTTTTTTSISEEQAYENWHVPTPVEKPRISMTNTSMLDENSNDAERNNMVRWHAEGISPPEPKTTRRMVARDEESQKLRGALWHEQHFESTNGKNDNLQRPPMSTNDVAFTENDDGMVRPPAAFYPDIDLSIPESVYKDDGSIDLVWDLLKWEAQAECQREPLLVSFLYSTILNHKSLESSLAFLLANRLQSPAMMISTQLQSIILDTLQRDAQARRYLRADILAVRDRDPACNCLPDVFLYFKGFHALQSHRVAHNLWKRNKQVLAHYLQSQVSQVFQIDIHPNATMQSGIMLDHGTGIVIGSTASVGHNCSILHHVTLGGSGVKGEKRHPTVGDGVLLGAGATVLGNVTLGQGSQVGAGTLVIQDLPSHCVSVGVPGRIIGQIVDVTEQPSVGMNQMIEGNSHMVTFESEGI